MTYLQDAIRRCLQLSVVRAKAILAFTKPAFDHFRKVETIGSWSHFSLSVTGRETFDNTSKFLDRQTELRSGVTVLEHSPCSLVLTDAASNLLSHRFRWKRIAGACNIRRSRSSTQRSSDRLRYPLSLLIHPK